MKTPSTDTRYLLYSSVAVSAFLLAFSVIPNNPSIQNQNEYAQTASVSAIPTIPEHAYRYIEIVASCDFEFKGECVNVRSGPGVEYPVVTRLRTGIVLLVKDTVMQDSQEWYKIDVGQGLVYPERITDDWYVASELVREFTNEGDRVVTNGEVASTTKHIVIDISEQKLFAYDGDILFMEELASTGLDITPTPRGIFTVLRMTPSRFMQGPIPEVSDQVYDLPGVPWDLYFTVDGAVIHGAYWHNHFGERWSHGCVNLDPQIAKRLYLWADLGMQVVVQD